MINAEGLCWCGQQWDGQAMCHVPQVSVADAAVAMPRPPLPADGALTTAAQPAQDASPSAEHAAQPAQQSAAATVMPAAGTSS
jgi:hypothetical protein